MSLDQRSIENIEADAAELLSEVFGNLQQVLLPVDVEMLVEYTGVALERVRFDDRDIAGSFRPNPPAIFVDDTDIAERQRFTIAHELGHYKLGHSAKMDGRTEVLYRQAADVASSSMEDLEQAANWYAAAILMPQAAVDKLWPLFKGDPSGMASAFGVSKSAMFFRLKNLGMTG